MQFPPVCSAPLGGRLVVELSTALASYATRPGPEKSSRHAGLERPNWQKLTAGYVQSDRRELSDTTGRSEIEERQPLEQTDVHSTH